MTPDPNLTADERAALIAAGALPAPEDTDLLGYDAVTAALFAAVEPVAPPTRVREQLLQRVDRDRTELVVRRCDKGRWREFVPGVTVKVLHRDRRSRGQTLLMRFTPGATLPAHDHAGAEECFVLEGEVESFGRRFAVGDYIRAAAGSRHDVSRSESGCLLLLMTSSDCETVPPLAAGRGCDVDARRAD